MLRTLCALSLWLAALSRPATAQAVIAAKPDTGVAAYAFDLSQVTLSSGRWLENQGRTLSYLKFVDLDRLLYVYRSNHKLSTKGANANGGWDAPSFPFRSHIQGHFLTAWAQCYAQLRDATCKDRAVSFVAELSKCQVRFVGNEQSNLGTNGDSQTITPQTLARVICQDFRSRTSMPSIQAP